MSAELGGPLPDWVQQINNQAGSKDSRIYRLFFYLMKELNLGYKDLCEMPVPAIFALTEQLKQHTKEQEREMRKARRK